MLCVTCDAKLVMDGEFYSVRMFPLLGCRQDVPIPEHDRPPKWMPKEADPIEVVKEDSFLRTYNSQELLPAPAPDIARAICAAFGLVAAGLVAATASTLLFAAYAIRGLGEQWE